MRSQTTTIISVNQYFHFLCLMHLLDHTHPHLLIASIHYYSLKHRGSWQWAALEGEAKTNKKITSYNSEVKACSCESNSSYMGTLIPCSSTGGKLKWSTCKLQGCFLMEALKEQDKMHRQRAVDCKKLALYSINMLFSIIIICSLTLHFHVFSLSEAIKLTIQLQHE